MPLPEEVKTEIYSRSLQTQDRYVEVLTSLEPPIPVMLGKYTSFRVVSPEPVWFKLLPYLKVELLSGPIAQKHAYMPRVTVHNYGRGYLPPQMRTTTGISYGGDKTPFGAAEESSFQAAYLHDGNGLRCQYCGGKRSAHRVWETEASRKLLLELHDLLEKSKEVSGYVGGTLAKAAHQAAAFARDKDASLKLGAPKLLTEKKAFDVRTKTAETTSTGFAAKEQVMLGVLVTEGSRPWAAYSGEARNWGSKDFFAEACRRLELRMAPHVSVGDPLAGRKNGKTQVKALSSCAAVKLLQAANQASETPKTMSECWFHPNQSKDYKYGRRATIESCDNCRLTLPAMLCPVDILDFQQQAVAH